MYVKGDSNQLSLPFSTTKKLWKIVLEKLLLRMVQKSGEKTTWDVKNRVDTGDNYHISTGFHWWFYRISEPATPKNPDPSLE